MEGKTQLPYNIFVYREELARRKHNALALTETKLVITHELITRNAGKVWQPCEEHSEILRRQLEFKNALIRKQWILTGGLEADNPKEVEQQHCDLNADSRFVYNPDALWPDFSNTTKEEDEFFLNADNFFNMHWSEGMNNDAKDQSDYSVDYNNADIWSDVRVAMLSENNFYINWD